MLINLMNWEMEYNRIPECYSTCRRRPAESKFEKLEADDFLNLSEMNKRFSRRMIKESKKDFKEDSKWLTKDCTH